MADLHHVTTTERAAELSDPEAAKEVIEDYDIPDPLNVEVRDGSLTLFGAIQLMCLSNMPGEKTVEHLLADLQNHFSDDTKLLVRTVGWAKCRTSYAYQYEVTPEEIRYNDLKGDKTEIPESEVGGP